MPSGWLEGMMPLLRKKNETGDINNNCRPITLMNIIHKLWDAIMPYRLNPLLNLLTQDSQYAYKSNKSTIDGLEMINAYKTATNRK